MALQVRPDGSVLVRAPLRTGMPVIRAFVAQHSDWIEKQRTKLANTSAVEKLSEEDLAALRREAAQYFAARAAYYAPLVGVRFGRITIRCQKSKWGSCSAKGNLNFNCLLMLAPEEVRDYVIVHELCHRPEMNHSEAFWQNVERVLPEWREQRRWLREHGDALMARIR